MYHPVTLSEKRTPSLTNAVLNAFYMDVLKCPQRPVGQLPRLLGRDDQQVALDSGNMLYFKGRVAPLGSTCRLLVWLLYCITFMRFFPGGSQSCVHVCLRECVSKPGKSLVNQFGRNRCAEEGMC